MYDITDRSSFDRVQGWVKELRRAVGEDISLFIAGNKADLDRQRVVSLDEAAKYHNCSSSHYKTIKIDDIIVSTTNRYAESVGAKHFSTSALANRGIEELFVALARQMLEEDEKRPAASKAGQRRGGITITEEDTKTKSDGCC